MPNRAASPSHGLDPLKIAGASISGWYPSAKTSGGRQPFTSQLEFALGLYLEFHPQVVSYQRGDLSADFARAHKLDTPLGTPYAITYAFEDRPHVYGGSPTQWDTRQVDREPAAAPTGPDRERAPL